MYNTLLLNQFRLKKYRNLNTPLLLEKEVIINEEDFSINKNIQLLYFKKKIIDIDNNYLIKEEEILSNYLSLGDDYKKKGFVYFMKINDIFKIGYTKNILKRVNQINQVNFKNIDYFTYFITSDYKHHEKQLLKIFSHMKTKGEKHKFTDLSLSIFLDYEKNIIKDSNIGLTFLL